MTSPDDGLVGRLRTVTQELLATEAALAAGSKGGRET